MNITESGKKVKFIEKTIREICSYYDYMSPGKIETFAPVFYPIANIELSMQERTFEDFEPVQLAVLKLMNIGYKQPEIIAKLLSLNAIYVGNIQKLLFGYQLIDSDYRVTDTGRESIGMGKKVQLVSSRQIFQLDAVNMSLIRLDKTIKEEALQDKETLSSRILILDYPDAIDSDVIISNLSSNDFNALMAQKKGVLNTNVERIDSIRCLDVFYVKAYLIKFIGKDTLFVFSKREDFTQKSPKEKYRWLPFSVPSETVATRLGLENVLISSEENVRMLDERFGQLNKYASTKEVKDLIDESIPLLLDAHGINGEMTHYEPLNHTVYITDSFGFRNADGYAIKDLYFLSEHGLIVSTDDKFAGNIVKIMIRDSRLKDAASKVRKAVDEAAQSGGGLSAGFVAITDRIEQLGSENPSANIVELIEKL